jgi:DNA mismatch endonuclease (patch repair protein)
VADTFTNTERSRIMAAVRSRGNKATELTLAALFRTAGLKGWRRHAAIPGRPDFIFPKQRLAIFVDGCFWHGCAKHCRMPASNKKYWNAKIARNIRRDRLIRQTLRHKGWSVLSIWEHELKSRPAAVAARVAKKLTSLPAPR